MTKEIHFFSDFLIGKQKPLSKEKKSEEILEKNADIIDDKEKVQENTENSNEKAEESKEFSNDNEIIEVDNQISRKRAVSHRKCEKQEEKIVEVSEQKENEVDEMEPTVTRSRAVSKRTNKIEVNNDNNANEGSNEENSSPNRERSRGKTTHTPSKICDSEIKKQFSQDMDEKNAGVSSKTNQEKFDFTLLDYFLAFLDQKQLNLVLAGYFEKVMIGLLSLRKKHVSFIFCCLSIILFFRFTNIL